jgi:hypothetical protein
VLWTFIWVDTFVTSLTRERRSFLREACHYKGGILGTTLRTAPEVKVIVAIPSLP